MERDDETPRELTCRELADFVMDYLDDALSAADRAAFDAHLGACEDCIAYLRSYRDTIRLARLAGAEDAQPPAMPEELVRAILAARRRPPS